METKEIIAFYKELSYEEQKKLLFALSSEIKSPPFFINFPMDQKGLYQMAKVAEYCQKYKIQYKPEKRKGGISFRFDNQGDRNTALIGRLTIQLKMEV